MHPTADIARGTFCIIEAPIAPARVSPRLGSCSEPVPDWDVLGQTEPDFEDRLAWGSWPPAGVRIRGRAAYGRHGQPSAYRLRRPLLGGQHDHAVLHELRGARGIA